MSRELPPNVHLLTLQALGTGSYLVRLEHQFEVDEVWSEPVNISLAVSICKHLMQCSFMRLMSLLSSACLPEKDAYQV